ncbi:hypothetical protein [Neobacillus rhizophilus]|uniref:Uncharacterized protein n=1 Tax=Neobacillus rhizophilus TaxID=2833579 RepID=A0A942UB40_9BACI|nr:hypothetical protein [Neobacillus rhizophilus]MBS4214119.1 hypothetical protein [Neobacillus rhizophilus]
MLKLTNPWIVGWWSATFPGFGHLLLGDFTLGSILVLFELAVNNFSHLNSSIYYSMLGDFDQAKEVLDKKWFLVYMPIYIFSIFDSYRRAVEVNKAYILAYREKKQDLYFQHLSPIGVSLLGKSSPANSVIWAFLSSGISSLYFKNIPNLIFALFWIGVLSWKSRLLESVLYSFILDFNMAKTVLNPQWLLFVPSVYVFFLYHTYLMNVSSNKIFDITLSRFLKRDFQQIKFPLPLKEE